MEDRNLLVDGVGIAYFQFTDGSVVRCEATCNRQLIDLYNIRYTGFKLYDIVARKAIPDRFLEDDVTCTIYKPEDDKDLRSELDKQFEIFVKNSW